MTDHPENTKPENPIIALARDRDLDAVEALWMERLETRNPDLEELFHAAQYLVSRRLEEHAGILLWSLVTSLAEHADPARVLAVARRAALTAPTETSLREELLNRYRQLHAGALRLDQILRDADLLRAEDLPAAVRLVENFLHLQPGAYLVHRMSHSPGRIKGFGDGHYLIESGGSEFRHRPDHVFQWWAPLEPDDFRAQLAFQPDTIRALADQDPAALIRKLLAGHTQTLDFKQLKAALIPGVVAQAEWSKWWARAKPALMQNPWLQLSPGSQPALTLRTEPADYTQTFLARLHTADSPCAQAHLVLEHLSNLHTRAEPEPQLAAHLGAELIRRAANADTVSALILLAAVAALHRELPDTPDPAAHLTQSLARLADAADLLAAIEKDDLARIVLESVRAAAPQRWPELFAQAFPAASLRTCDWLARELDHAGHPQLLHTAAETAAAMPDKYPLAFGWVWRHLLTAGGPLAEKISPLAASAGLLRLLHRLQRLPRHAADRARGRRALTKLRSLIAAGHCKHLKDLIARTDAAQAAQLHEAIAAGDGLTGETRHELLDALNEAHPEQFIRKQNPWEDGNLYHSAAGHAKLQDALEKILHHDMRQNAIAIGAAAAKGDLRENWEYKSALEERDRLVERATRMRQELDRARILNPADIATDHVTVGVAVRLRHTETNEEHRLTFLGPWDADLEHRVYSYLAPLSLSFMGKKTGDLVTADLGRGPAEYEIAAIEPAV